MQHQKSEQDCRCSQGNVLSVMELSNERTSQTTVFCVHRSQEIEKKIFVNFMKKGKKEGKMKTKK